MKPEADSNVILESFHPGEVHMVKERAAPQQLLEKIYCERGFDFREYKETTLNRRIGRRLRA